MKKKTQFLSTKVKNMEFGTRFSINVCIPTKF